MSSNMQNIIGPIVFFAVAVLLIWSGVRAWRASNRLLRWSGVGLAAGLAVAVSSVEALTIVGMLKQHSRSAPVPSLKVEATAERIVRGQALR
jgi:hypothetical protein